MNLIDRIFDLLPLIILIAASSSTKKKRTEKKQAERRESNRERRNTEVKTDNRYPASQMNSQAKKTKNKKEAKNKSIFEQFREAVEESIKEAEERTRTVKSRPRSRSPRQEAIDRDLYLPRKYEDLAYLKDSLSYKYKKIGMDKSKKAVEIDMGQEDILRGIIFAEILSPPKSRRR